MARILVLEMDRPLRMALGIALRRAGHEVEAVEAAEEGLALAQDGSFDLVLADAQAAGMDPADLLLALKRDCPETGVIVTTAIPSIESAVEVMRLGACNYVRKPFEVETVLEVVAKALDRAEPASEEAPQRRAQMRSVFSGIIGASPAIRDLLDLVSKVAHTDSTVLITGETGTGKELIGRAIHEASRRRDRVFCALNSAAFPETLLESELFGHQRGAFTGASTKKRGLFEHAHQGTVFLDELAEMPLSMQAKLLRFLQTGEIRPVGSESTRLVDVRLVTATNKDLESEVAAGRFREDLYYRLAVIPIRVPPLRERVEDIPRLASFFLRRYAAKLGKPVEDLEPGAIELLAAYAWPGNVRELENTIERGVALCRGSRIGCDDLPDRLRRPVAVAVVAPTLQSLGSLERRHILETLDKVGWNRKRAAQVLQISTTTLWRRLKEIGVDGDGSRAAAGGPGAEPPRLLEGKILG